MGATALERGVQPVGPQETLPLLQSGRSATRFRVHDDGVADFPCLAERKPEQPGNDKRRIDSVIPVLVGLAPNLLRGSASSVHVDICLWRCAGCISHLNFRWEALRLLAESRSIIGPRVWLRYREKPRRVDTILHLPRHEWTCARYRCSSLFARVSQIPESMFELGK